MNISVTIITKNEEDNMMDCLNSASFADEIIVVDSGSTDKTVEIAERHGAKVFVNEFEGYGKQKNYAAQKASGEWIFNIDADERISEELKNSLLQITNDQNKSLQKDVYYCPRLTNFCGKWIRHGGWYPNRIARLAKKDKGIWTEPEVHEKLIPKSKDRPDLYGELQGDLLHYSFPTIQSQIQTNYHFAHLGAKELVKKMSAGPSLLQVLLKPLGKFIECYFLKRGFLDGKYGLLIALNAAYSLFMKYSMAYVDLKLEK